MAHFHTLTSVGLLGNNREIVKQIFQYFLTISATQSNFYRGHITSYREIFKEYKNNIDRMEEEVEEKLTILYGRYFPEVEINCSAVKVDDGIYQLQIKGTMVDENKERILLNEGVEVNTDEKIG